MQAKLSEAQKLGAETIMPPMQLPDGPEIAMFADLEGDAIGVAMM